jgi:hypothetical protein
MKRAIIHLEAFISVALGDMHILDALEEAEGAGLVEALGGVMVAADYDHWNPCLDQPLQTPLKDEQGLYLGPDMMEDITGMDHSIGMSLDDLVDGLFKSGVDHLLDPVPAVLVQTAVAGKAQVRVRQMDYLHEYPSPYIIPSCLCPLIPGRA